MHLHRIVEATSRKRIPTPPANVEDGQRSALLRWCLRALRVFIASFKVR